jgi:hypothetical protein
MFKQLCLIFLFMLSFSTTTVAADYQSESVKNSLTDSTKAEKIQPGEESLPNPIQESDLEDEEPSIFDDDHGC